MLSGSVLDGSHASDVLAEELGLVGVDHPDTVEPDAGQDDHRYDVNQTLQSKEK